MFCLVKLLFQRAPIMRCYKYATPFTDGKGEHEHPTNKGPDKNFVTFMRKV